VLFQYPIPRENFYNEDYYSGKAEYSYIDEREDKIIRDIELPRRLNIIIKTLLRDIDDLRLNGKLRLLDIGSAYGVFVQFANKVGFEAVGYDTSQVSTGIKKDVCVEPIDGKFHVVTLIETIEHMTDPVSALKHIHDGMYDRGILVIQTANFNSWVRKLEGKNSKYFLPGHIFYFNKKVLCEQLEKIGFEIIKVYHSHETGFIPAIIRKLITNRGRHSGSDLKIFIITLILHLLSKLNIGLPVNGGMVLYARSRNNSDN
jgi:SAM-dependent methyltransferase